jgi:signal peptidase I
MERSIRWVALGLFAVAAAIAFAGVIVLATRPEQATPSPQGTNLAKACAAVDPGSTRLRIEQESMEPTLSQNDVVLVELRQPTTIFRRADIVVFPQPGADQNSAPAWVKRVIGIAGDMVAIHDGSVFVNGDRLPEPYASGATSPNGDADSWSVSYGKLFVVGDNRDNSTDSRSSVIGLVPVDSVIGRVVYRCAPSERAGPVN